MKIAFVSTRGIPNNYGGFEQFTEYIFVGLDVKQSSLHIKRTNIMMCASNNPTTLKHEWMSDKGEIKDFSMRGSSCEV